MWLLVPAGLIGLALLVPATLVVVERVRTAGARSAPYDASSLELELEPVVRELDAGRRAAAPPDGG